MTGSSTDSDKIYSFRSLLSAYRVVQTTAFGADQLNRKYIYVTDKGFEALWDDEISSYYGKVLPLTRSILGNVAQDVEVTSSFDSVFESIGESIQNYESTHVVKEVPSSSVQDIRTDIDELFHDIVSLGNVIAIFNAREMGEIIQDLEELVVILERIRSDLALFNRVLKRAEVTDIERRIDAIEEARERMNLRVQVLQQYLSLSCFHAECDSQRAAGLLQDKPAGAYLLRPSNKAEVFTLTYLKREESSPPEILHAELIPLPDGKLQYKVPLADRFLFCGNGTLELPLEEIVRVLSCIDAIIAIPNQPLDHLQAQFELNVTPLSVEETLPDAPVGSVCITRGDLLGEYLLHIVRSRDDDAAINIHKETVRLIDGKIKTRHHEADSLYQLLSEKLGLEYHVLCKRPPASTIEQLFYRELLPSMYKNGIEWIKISRGDYPFLAHSLFCNDKGSLFRQIHQTDSILANGIMVMGSGDKRLRGKGSYKRVWDLQPFHPRVDLPSLVRGRFIHSSVTFFVREMVTTLKNLHNDGLGEDSNLLLPKIVTHRPPYEDPTERVSLIMPAMEKDLSKIFPRLSYRGRLRAALQIANGLTVMHAKGWAHLDIKPANIMVVDAEQLDDPEVKITDFDFAIKVQPGQKVRNGSPIYKDPVINSFAGCKGILSAQVADQFSFGILLIEILTGTVLDRSEIEIFHGHEVREYFLDEHPGFAELNSELQDIIRFCTLGFNRIPAMSEIATRLEGVLQELSSDSV